MLVNFKSFCFIADVICNIEVECLGTKAVWKIQLLWSYVAVD